jgi:hypothetical protein
VLHADLAQHLLAGFVTVCSWSVFLHVPHKGGHQYFPACGAQQKDMLPLRMEPCMLATFGHTGGSQPLLHVDERKRGRQQVQPVLHTMTSDAAL